MITQFGIHIKVKDIEKSLAFYLSFGMKPVFVYGNKDFTNRFRKVISVLEKYRGVIFTTKGALFEIADGHLAVKKRVFQESIPSSKVSAMLYVSSVVKVKKLCEKYSYSIVAPIRDFPWGTKEIVVKDPDGFILVFIEKTKENKG